MYGMVGRVDDGAGTFVFMVMSMLVIGLRGVLCVELEC